MATSPVGSVWRAFNVITTKFQNLRFDYRENRADRIKPTTRSEKKVTGKLETKVMRHSAQAMELDLLERRIRRLVAKLAKQNVQLEVFDHKDIEYGAVLGKGGEGIVQRCKVLYNDLPVDAAIKTVLNNSDDALAITLDEIELLCLAKDPIVTTTLQVYGVAAVPEPSDPTYGHLVIITEAGIKNSLQLYQNEGRAIPLHVTYDFWARLAGALHCIHTKRIIHQDVKPENILVTSILRDEHGEIEKIQFKIIDLGMGRRLVTDRVVSDDILGTNGYHAPEVLFDDSHDIRADIFMLGITFCVMLLPPASLRKAALQSLLKKVHEAKEQKVFGGSLFASVFEPLMTSGAACAGADISVPIRNMLCTMLEHLDRRSVTLLDIVGLCNHEATSLHEQQLNPAACPLDSGIDSIGGECMASQRTLHKIAVLEGHVLRMSSPRRLRSNKKRSPARIVQRSSDSTSSDESCATTPTKTVVKKVLARTRKWSATPRPQRRTVRRFSVSTTSSVDSEPSTTPRKTVARRRPLVTAVLMTPCDRQTRQSKTKRRRRDTDPADSDDDVSKPSPPAKRVLRSSSFRP